MTKTLLGVLYLCVAGTAFAAAPDGDAITVVRAGKLIDVVGGRVLSDQTILIRGKTIEAVGPAVAIPGGAKVIVRHDGVARPGRLPYPRSRHRLS